MRRLIPIALGLMLMLAGASADQAFALGLGGYVYGGGGPAEGNYDRDSRSDFDMDGDTLHRGVGFVMEVHPTGESIFNYRLSVGFERFEASFDFDDESPTFGPEFDLFGMAMDHTFGFAVRRHDDARLWIGPTVHGGVYAGTGDIDQPSPDPTLRGDAVIAELGVGAAFGANFHIGDRLTISPTMGFRGSVYTGINEHENLDDKVTASGGTVFINLVFMARTGDDAK